MTFVALPFHRKSIWRHMCLQFMKEKCHSTVECDICGSGFSAFWRHMKRRSHLNVMLVVLALDQSRFKKTHSFNLWSHSNVLFVALPFHKNTLWRHMCLQFMKEKCHSSVTFVTLFFPQNYMCLQFMKKTREFKCVTCAAIFGLMQNLNRHINLVHQENKPCKCKLCTIALTGKTDLNRHISSVHEEKYY